MAHQDVQRQDRIRIPLEPQVGKIYRASASKGIKVYKKATTKASVKGTLTRKYSVVLLAKSGNWGLIRVIKNGKVGYVPLKNLTAA